MEGEGDEVREPSSVATGGEPDPTAGGGEPDQTAATTESLPAMTNLEWGKAAYSEEAIEKWTADDAFRPGDLVEWRAPIKDETPTPSVLEDQFVILSLTHIMCGLRVDASNFLVSVLAHYGIQWSHLTPNSITALSIFAHLCEAYLGVPPTVEVFSHFYRVYVNKKGETTTLGGVYFRLRDKMKRKYPMYYLKTSQFMWNSAWFYAKLPHGCRLTFRGDALKMTSSWKDVLLLSPGQEKQVLQIEELSNQGLTGVDIVFDYLKHRISPLRRRAHLACKYTGPTDPTRDSDEDLSVEDIECKLSYLLDLKKTGQKVPPNRPNVPTSLVGASADERANRPLGLLHVPSTHEAKKKAVEETTDSKKFRESAKRAYKSVPASPRRYTRQSAGPRKTIVPPTPEIDSSLVRGLSETEEEIQEAKTTMPTAASPNQGIEQKSIEQCDEIEEGERAELAKTISSVIGAKRKSFTSRSGSQRKAKYSLHSIMARTRMSSMDTDSIKGASSTKKASGALNSQSPSPASSAEEGNNSALFILANVLVNQNQVAEESMLNVLLNQPVRDSPPKAPKDVNLARYISKKVQDQETIEESALIPVRNPEEINSEVIWERMQKVHREYATLSEAAFSELLEQAKKLVMENKRLKDGQIMLEQQVKELEENRRFLTDTVRKAEHEVIKRTEEHAKLKDENRGQKQMIEELSKQNESFQGALVQKSTEVNRLKEEAAELTKDKEDLQSRVSRANELLKLMTSTLCHGKSDANKAP